MGESESKGITSHGDWFSWHTWVCKVSSRGTTEPPPLPVEEKRRGDSFAFLRILMEEDTKIREWIRLCNFPLCVCVCVWLRERSLSYFSVLQISQNSIIRVWLACCLLPFFLSRPFVSYVAICCASWTILPLGFGAIYVGE